MKAGDLIQFDGTGFVRLPSLVFLVIEAYPFGVNEIRCRLLARNEQYFDFIIPANNPYRGIRVLARGMS